MKGFIKKIEQINFGLMSPENIRDMSVVTVETPDTYEDDGFPIEKGLMDPRLGVIDPSLVCRTCGFRGGDCQGHFGSIELARPVIHIGFGDVIHKILRSTCNECGRVLLSNDDIEKYTQRIHEAMDNRESLNAILKDVYKVAKRELKNLPEDPDEEVDQKHCCPHCGAPQEAIILDKPVTIRQGDYKLTASEVRERLERISDEDSFVLGVNPEVARPEWLVLTVLPVPPVTVRPSITLDTGERSEDDLTHKLVDILRINQRLLENMEAGAPQLIVEDLWELLQYHVTTYFDNEASGVPPARHRSGRPLKTLTQRLKGKEGRFRSNLSGKRVNFSARTVISPDPNISINEVGVPEMIAKEVTVPVYVNEWNIEEMKKYIMNGPDVHPGANYVIRNDGRKIRVRNEETIELILEQLEPGFIIERHLKDGDMVLFNRQPSLHRMSMMAHEVRVLPYKTFRLNLCVCPPYNADFDGDEMNMHVFQTDESRAEAKSLMRVQEHILSPRFGGPIIGAIHDHISGAYLLTRDGVEFTEEQALQIIRKSHLALPEFKGGQWVLKTNLDLKPDSEVPHDIEESYIYKDKGAMWTGKELFSLLLPNDLNLSYSAEISKCPVVYPASDASVVIKNGILEQGVIDESAYGSFSGKILDKIVKEYGPGRAKEFLDRSTDLAICGIMKTGITTSLNDEEIPEEAQDRINEHLEKKMAEVDKLVESYEEGYLQALPGRSLEETLEMKIMQVLGEARDMSGNIAENYLTMGKQSDDDPYDHVMAVENHSVVMARTGARASMLNLTQITACVGQQAVRGGRIERGYLNRTLPHFKKGELGAKAKGFVHSSYKSGLDPIEFFFHAMGGREGLVDTAIRTAQSGYMQRRLVNALQDLQVKPSGLVTDNQGNVIQTMFGEDGVDPAKSDFGKPADLNKLIDEIRMEGK
ncbi:MAG: DNA-directed RNA polymerase subunit A' [Methanobrevibacter sp.]|uniref:DNA-directed RNA polymerase subunit A' n=1 Tax=Methanobrevibacter sp. TaxID=66852 RepID=UPI0025F3C934|nr:DNA-directed RNA polymerase subunit A' [Methanobrevibacter sp.]MBQ8018626.1 DNA-directed RNA polymerase subunit A' [Methanobrevibacter sp.]